MDPPARDPRGGPRRAVLRAAGASGLAIVVLLLVSPGLPGSPVARTAAPAVVHTTPFVKHVVMIVLENELLSQVWAHGPYERYLAHTYGNVTNFYAACHPSAPNYLALIAAVTNQCGSDNWYNDTNTTLGDLLLAQNYTYSAYAQNLSAKACPHPGTATAGLFATRHVPFLYFRDVLQNQSFCRAHVQPAANFTASVVNGTLPSYSFYTPNLCNDGHNGCGGNYTMAQETAQADAWLAGFLAPILNHTGPYSSKAEQTLIRHTLFIVLWDEALGAGSTTGYPVTGVKSLDTYRYCKANNASGDAVCGGHVFATFVSRYSLGTNFTGLASDFNIVRTVEWLFHLPHLKNNGGFDARAGFPVLKSLFTFSSNGY